MKTTFLFRSLALWPVFLVCLLAACSKDEETGLAPFRKITMEGEACTLQMDMARGGWRIASVITPWGETMKDKYGKPLQLEGTGSLHYRWWDLERSADTHLTLHLKDNFDLGERRFLVLNLEMKEGFYKEQVVITQNACHNFYEIESLTYSLEEGDGVSEAETGRYGLKYREERGSDESDTFTVHPFINEWTTYQFSFDDRVENYFSWVNPQKRFVNLPDRIEAGKIVVNEAPLPFKEESTYFKDEELRKKGFEVQMIPSKWNIYAADIYYKRLKLTFCLTLARPGSDTKQVLKGKLTQKYPYDCSPVRYTTEDYQGE
ncbi:hypothetical protein JN06_00550 [Bacteroides zoogleoformans]|uniref:Uncharacterized protein n=1 Tax=Bacteroides zoogleoformans TaxID=28119 RepID=A0ABN5IMF1_9BACE|nr:hypothetical protein [Bacteroides zoogleoformans]AVM54055.1 hypothetical protein C4H11_09340 [Bacteroides zoogleoformans]TWJ17975.1 hypothetical protein JN06_00550 [Bacteroides zoogleoformans]